MNKNRMRGGGRGTSGQVAVKSISIKRARRKLRWRCAESDRTYLGRSASCPLRVLGPKADGARRKTRERGAEVSRGQSSWRRLSRRNRDRATAKARTERGAVSRTHDS